MYCLMNHSTNRTNIRTKSNGPKEKLILPLWRQFKANKLFTGAKDSNNFGINKNVYKTPARLELAEFKSFSVEDPNERIARIYNTLIPKYKTAKELETAKNDEKKSANNKRDNLDGQALDNLEPPSKRQKLNNCTVDLNENTNNNSNNKSVST